jgi:hypothetical protein
VQNLAKKTERDILRWVASRTVEEEFKEKTKKEAADDDAKGRGAPKTRATGQKRQGGSRQVDGHAEGR